VSYTPHSVVVKSGDLSVNRFVLIRPLEYFVYCIHKNGTLPLYIFHTALIV